MWEDFMRGNWPAVASAAPDPVLLPSATSAATLPASHPRTTVRAEAAPRAATGKVAFKAAIAAGAGLVLAVLAPASAVAGNTHAIGAHTHAAAHAATGP